MTSLNHLADTYRHLAEAHDNISESARREADAAKERALEGLSDAIRARLIEGLGGATNDRERLEVVARLYRAVLGTIESLGGSVTSAGGPTADSPAQRDRELLEALMRLLGDVYVNETLRDHYRRIAAIFSG